LDEKAFTTEDTEDTEKQEENTIRGAIALGGKRVVAEL
jgi:hypothetical protein